MDGQEIAVPDGESIMPAAEQLGIYFGCQEGNCGVCEVEIVEGYDNLTALTEAERDFRLLDNRRLACQCKLKQGIVKMRV